MEYLDKLSEEERNMVMMAPALISILAANEDGKLDKGEKRRAIELSHIKTFTSHPSLKEYYEEVDKVFMSHIDILDSDLPKDKSEREQEIKKKLKQLEAIFAKLDYGFSLRLRDSLKSYIRHVADSHFNVLPAFLDPFYWLF